MPRAYIVGVCGTGTGALAGLLGEQGWEVEGSDQATYPPMSAQLAAWGVPVHLGWDARRLAAPRPPFDLVVVGNVIRADNPEAQAALARGLEVLSMPQAIARFGIGERHSLVVAGTHGKTTTTALLAHVLAAAGRDPGYLIGGIPVAGGRSFHAGGGGCFVVEGDEYDTAFFDKEPKFLHYRARTAIITSLEFDHADIFADLAAVEAAFGKLIAAAGPASHLVIWRGAGVAPTLAGRSRAGEVTLYDLAAGPGVGCHLAAWQTGPAGTTIAPVVAGEALPTMQVPLWGEMAALAALAVVAATYKTFCDAAQLAAGLASFAGVRRRMEVRGTLGGVTVVDDFAHHPTAVAKTLAAARQRWPGARLWALFEPRSATSRRNLFAAAYLAAFAGADRVIIGHHPRLGEVAPEQRFDPDGLAAALARAGTPAWSEAQPEAIAERVGEQARPGDVVMLLSNGDFGGLLGLLEARLASGRRRGEGAAP